MNGTRHYTARLYTPRRNGKEVSALPPPPPSKIVFLDGFNEYRMFIVTIPCDSHKRQKSTSTLPPLLCTLPTLPSLPPPIPQSTTKEEEGVGKKKNQICGETQQDCCALSLLSAQIPIRQTEYGVKVQQRVTKTTVFGWRAGGSARERRDKMCSEKVPHDATSRRNTICVLFLFFKVAKIIQKPNQYVRGAGKKGYLFSVVCDNVFFVWWLHVNLFSFYKLSFVLLQTLGSSMRWCVWQDGKIQRRKKRKASKK